MDDVSGASALVLAAVFTWAAVAKIARPAQTRASFAALGVPSAGVASVVVPAVELGLAAGLIAMPSMFGWAGVALLAGFTAVVVRGIARGVQTPCSCFGSARDEPVSSTEVVRNGLLIALAVVATGAAESPIVAVPDLAAAVLVTVTAALGRVALAIVDFRRTAGRLWPPMPGSGA